MKINAKSQQSIQIKMTTCTVPAELFFRYPYNHLVETRRYNILMFLTELKG